MSVIIKLEGLPLEANSVDVRLYFLGLTIPDGGVHIVGGDMGSVFIEFASDEDARRAMERGNGTIKNSNVKLSLSSRSEMQSVIDAIHQKHRQFIQQQQQQQQPQSQPQPQPQPQSQPQSQPQPQLQPQLQLQLLPQPQSQPQPQLQPQLQPQSQQQQQQQNEQPLPFQPFQQQPMLLPQVVQQPWCPVPQPAPLLPWAQQAAHPPLTQASLLYPNQTLNPHNQQQAQHLLLPQQQAQQQQPPQQQLQQYNQANNRARGMSGMRGGDDKLFADRRCVLAASNLPYRATSKDIIDFLAEFGINEERIRRRYNTKGQPTADAKIAFPTPEAAMKAMKNMNKKALCGRPVFFKPV